MPKNMVFLVLLVVFFSFNAFAGELSPGAQRYLDWYYQVFPEEQQTPYCGKYLRTQLMDVNKRFAQERKEHKISKQDYNAVYRYLKGRCE